MGKSHDGVFFFSSRRRHTRFDCDWSSDVCSSDLEISAVVAISPPRMIFGGFPHSNKPKWIYKNSPIMPFIGGFSGDDINLTEADDLFKTTENDIIPFHAGTFDDPYVVTPLFLKRIEKNKSLLDALAIQVEKIQCPLLIITGEDDQVHPATMHGNLIMDRLEKYHSTIDRKHIHYSNAGHSLRTPYEPKIDLPWFVADNVFCYSGGTIEGNYRASVHAWKEMMSFFDRGQECPRPRKCTMSAVTA